MKQLKSKVLPSQLIFFLVALDVQKKLENLRTYFGKEVGKEKECQPKSGAAAKEAFKSSWPWFNSLMWLKDHMGTKDSTSNLNSSLEDDEISTCSSSGYSSSRKNPKPNVEEKIIKAAEAIANKIPDFQSLKTSSPKKARLSDDDHFGQMIARKLEKIPEGEEKENLKLEIQMLIKNVQFGRRLNTFSGNHNFFSN